MCHFLAADAATKNDAHKRPSLFMVVLCLKQSERNGRFMERYAWKAWIADGKLEEYKKRHDEIWPEMTKLLNEAGIHNYSIWNTGNELFAYFECDIDYEKSLEIQMQSQIGKRWNKYMEGIFVLEARTQAPVTLERVFFHK